MFELPKPRVSRRNAALALSFVVHCVGVFLWVHREPIFVKPSSVAWGRQGTSGTLIYLPPRLELDKSDVHPMLQYLPKRKLGPPAPPLEADSMRAGKTAGSLSSGPARGIEATPAIPLNFPDPDVYPWQVRDVQGDVVVEVTIDEKGIVSDTRLLQSLKQEIDEKCVATVRNWRFRPAMVDGVAIASRQDVHFHFPS